MISAVVCSCLQPGILLRHQHHCPLHSVGASCEDDDSVGALQNVRTFVSTKCTSASSRPIHREYYNTQEGTFTFSAQPEDVMNIYAYVAGFVAKHLLVRSSGCEHCKVNILSREVQDDEFHRIIELKEYDSERKSLYFFLVI